MARPDLRRPRKLRSEPDKWSTPDPLLQRLTEGKWNRVSDSTAPPGTLADAAIAYARAGHAVLPLKPGTKVPNTVNGKNDATTDVETIRRWWNRDPDSNIGLRPAQGVAVIDVESVAGHGFDGYATLAALVEELGPLPEDAPSAETATGGLHVWLAGVDGPTVAKLGPGIDVKTHTGYLVAAPSVIDRREYERKNQPVPEWLDEGSQYRWRSTPLNGVAVPPAPKAWASRLVKPERPQQTSIAPTPTTSVGNQPWVTRAVSKELKALRGCEEGGGRWRGRYDELNAVGIRLARMPDVDRAWLRAELIEASRDNGYLGEEGIGKVERDITSAFAYADGQGLAPIPASKAPNLSESSDSDEFDDDFDSDDDESDDDSDRAVDGATFILDRPDTIPTIWGKGNEILWATGEALMIASVMGLGKTTLAGQLVRALLLGGNVFDLPLVATNRPILYLAMDRPRQIARSMARQFTEADRELLAHGLIIRPGPPPADLAKHPTLLLSMAEQYSAGTVFIDSLKDAAIGLSDDETGAAYNRARQHVLAAGIELCELHHTVKRNAQGGAPATAADVYGSTWLTAGTGSVIMLTGEPGDPIVGFRHVKQPSEEVGPYQLSSDQTAGELSIEQSTDLVAFAWLCAADGVTAKSAAQNMFDTKSPTRPQTEKARRRLDKLTEAKQLVRVDGTMGGPSGGTPTTWFPL